MNKDLKFLIYVLSALIIAGLISFASLGVQHSNFGPGAASCVGPDGVKFKCPGVFLGYSKGSPVSYYSNSYDSSSHTLGSYSLDYGRFLINTAIWIVPVATGLYCFEILTQGKRTARK